MSDLVRSRNGGHMNRKSFYEFGMRCLVIAWWGVVFWGAMKIGSHEDDEVVVQEQPSHGKRVLRILSWPDIFDKEYLREFEEKYNVAVEISSYDSNEELIVKLRGSQGHGYDLIMPSDYAVTLLRKEGLLRPLSADRIQKHVARLNPLLKGLAHDVHNEYSMPYEWEIFGIAYAKQFFPDGPPRKSWGLLFDDPKGAYKVVTTNDPREVVRTAAYYRFGNVPELSEEQMQEIEQLLCRQHAWTTAYSTTNLDYYLISGYGAVAFASSAYVGRRKFFANRIGFFVPDEGGLVTIENFAIPVHAAHEDLVYDFIDFIFTPESLIHHHQTFTFFPATNDLLSLETLDPAVRELVTMPESSFKKLIPIKQMMPEERMNMLWVSIKSQ